jgi:Rap1a immunity proteins
MWQRDYTGGYISGLLDATILRLNTPGRRVICIDPDADKDKVVDRIFSYVEEPKDKKSAASAFIALAILAAFTCKVPGQ